MSTKKRKKFSKSEKKELTTVQNKQTSRKTEKSY